MTKRFIIGTAGHIDHGKTSLVKALTGVNTDRLPEEQQRGITIDLGFASWQVSETHQASIIDVPGHEKFVRTMASGAGGIDLVMLVVAADDGVMPQTKEHLAICHFLGVRKGLVVLTKADMSDDEMIELVREDIRETTQGTFLEGAAVIPCSSLTGAGIQDIAAEVERIADTLPHRQESRRSFLPIDRVFSKSGFGTVVTGTLTLGTLEKSQSVDLLPGPRGEPITGVTIRGIQNHSEDVDNVSAGTRVALNLRGVSHEEVSRGNVLVSSGENETTTQVHARLERIADGPLLQSGEELSLHIGTSDHLVRFTFLGEHDDTQGGPLYARLTSLEPMVCFSGQTFVLRKPGLHGQGTVAGGTLLDISPSTGKGSFARWSKIVRQLDTEDLENQILAYVEDNRHLGLSEKGLALRMPPTSDYASTLANLIATEKVFRFPLKGEYWLILPDCIDEVEQRLQESCKRFHERQPILFGPSPKELQSQMSILMQDTALFCIQRLIEQGVFVEEKGAIGLSSHEPSEEHRALLSSVLAAIQTGGVTPQTDDELLQSLSLDGSTLQEVLTELKRRDEIILLDAGLHFARTPLDALQKRVEAFFQDGASELNMADFKKLANDASRKFAIPLLEWLDAQGTTKRQGNVRIHPTQRS